MKYIKFLSIYFVLNIFLGRRDRSWSKTRPVRIILIFFAVVASAAFSFATQRLLPRKLSTTWVGNEVLQN